MMVARKMDRLTNNRFLGEEGEDDAILNFIVERKHVIDLVSSITATARGKYKPLSRMEQQMYKMKHAGVAKPMILIEGNEDRYGRREMMEERKKAVKTFREMLREGEFFPEFTVVETPHINATVQYLIGEVRRMTAVFREELTTTSTTNTAAMTMTTAMMRGGKAVAEVGTFGNLKQRVEKTMQDQTFAYYIGLLNLKAIGEKKAMAVMERYVTVASLANVCSINNGNDDDDDDDCLKVLSALKTKAGKGGRKLGMAAAREIKNWCRMHWVQINSLRHAEHALPFGSPSIHKDRSSTIIDPL